MAIPLGRSLCEFWTGPPNPKGGYCLIGPGNLPESSHFWRVQVGVVPRLLVLSAGHHFFFFLFFLFFSSGPLVSSLSNRQSSMRNQSPVTQWMNQVEVPQTLVRWVFCWYLAWSGLAHLIVLRVNVWGRSFLFSCVFMRKLTQSRERSSSHVCESVGSAPCLRHKCHCQTEIDDSWTLCLIPSTDNILEPHHRYVSTDTLSCFHGHYTNRSSSLLCLWFLFLMKNWRYADLMVMLTSSSLRCPPCRLCWSSCWLCWPPVDFPLTSLLTFRWLRDDLPLTFRWPPSRWLHVDLLTSC